MGVEDELLRRIQAALGRADLEVEAMVEEARQAARAEVSSVLQRAFQYELLRRTAEVVDGSTVGDSSSETPHSPTVAPPPAGHPDPARSPDGSSTAPGDGVTGPQMAPAPPGDDAHRAAAGPPATYVFGITRTGFDLDADLPAVGDGRVRSVDAGGLRAVVCDADTDVLRDLAELGPDDLERLATVANAHEDVLVGVAAQAAVLPLRLGTMLQDDWVVATLLTANARTLHAELDRLEGHAEWAVVVRLDRGGPAEPEELRAATGGEYLRHRQNALAARERRWEARDRVTSDLHERFSAVAVEADTVHERPLEETPPALHGVYLVTWEGTDRFHSLVDDAREAYPEAVIQATGPLPPYHFTSVDLVADGEAA